MKRRWVARVVIGILTGVAVAVAFAVTSLDTLWVGQRALANANIGLPAFLRTPGVGEQLTIPERDSFGKMMPRDIVAVVVLPDCSSCSKRAIDSLDIGGISDKPRTLIVASSTKQELAAYFDLGALQGFPLIALPDVAKFGDNVIGHGPYFVKLRSGRIQEVSTDAAAIAN